MNTYLFTINPSSRHVPAGLSSVYNSQSLTNIGIGHGVSYVNICQVLRLLLKTEAKGRGFQ